MPIPITQTPVADVFSQYRMQALNVKQYCTNIQNILSGGPVPANMLMDLFQAGAAMEAGVAGILGNAALAAELVSYMQTMAADPKWDVASDIQASLMAMGALTAALYAEIPKSVDGTLSDRTLKTDGSVVTTQVTAEALPRTSVAIAAWLATVS